MGILFRLIETMLDFFSLSYGVLFDDVYPTFNASTDVVVTFSGLAGSIQVYSADDNVKLGFDVATDASSMILPKNTVHTVNKPVKKLYIKGTTLGGAVRILSSNLNEGKSHEEIRQELQVRKL